MPELKRSMVFRGTRDIKLGLVSVLREIFASTLIEEQYRYVAPPADPKTPDETKIKIYRAFPERLNFYPCIIASVNPFDARQVAMGDTAEIATDKFDEFGAILEETFTGYMIIPVTLTIYSKESTDTREKLMDILLMLFKILARELIARVGVSITQMRSGGEGQFADEKDNKMVYTNSMIVDCQTDYTMVLSADQAQIVNSIFIKVFGQEYPGAPLELLAPE